MANVPRVTRRVFTDSMPGVRKTSYDTDTSLGVGVEQAKIREAGAIVQFGQKIGDLEGVLEKQAVKEVVKEQERAHDIAMMEADNKLSEWTTKRVYDPQQGALTVHGKDAMGLPEQVVGEFTKQADDVANGLTTPRQKADFAKIRLRHEANLDMTLRRHTFQEIERYEGQQLESTVINATNAALASDDPRRVQEELAKAKTAIATSGPRVGLTPEQITQQTAAVESTIYGSVMEKLIDQNKLTDARIYWEEKGSKVIGAAHVRVEKALAAGTVKKEAQTKADAIMAATPGDLVAQKKATAKIDDADQREIATRIVEHEYDVQQSLLQDAHRKMTTDAKNRIDKGASYDSLPESIKGALTLGESASLRGYDDWRAKELPPVKTNPAVYDRFNKLLVSDDPDEVAAFYKTNLMEYVGQLSTSDWQRFSDLQTIGARQLTDKARALLVNQNNQNRMVDEALTGLGMDPRPPDPGSKGFDQKAVDKVNSFRRTAREMVETLEFNQKKQATDDQVQAIVDRLRKPIGKAIVKEGWWWWESDQYRDQGAWETAKSYNDIPIETRRGYEEGIKLSGDVVTKEKVLELYRAYLAGVQPRRKVVKK